MAKIPKHPNRATSPPLDTWVHISAAVKEALDLLLAEAEAHAEKLDGMRVPISAAAKPWSETIDRIEAEREETAA
jgi:hypothetical protein